MRITRRKSVPVATLLLILACAGLLLIPKATQPDETQAGKFVELAQVAADRGDSQEARKLIEQALSAAPDYPEALLYRGLFEDEDGDAAAALKTLQSIPAEAGRIAGTARFFEGQILLTANRAREAEDRFRQARVIYPDYAPPLRELARLFAVQWRGEELSAALKQLRLLRRLNREQAAWLVLAGRKVIGDAIAVPQLKAFVNADPDDRMSRAALLRYLESMGQLDEAGSFVSEDSKIAGSDTLVQISALIRQRRDRAMSLDRVLRQLPDEADPTIPYCRACGQFSEDQANWALAVDIYRHLLERLPFDVSASYRLSRALEASNRHDDAARQRRTTAELDELERLAYLMLDSRAEAPELAAPTAVSIARILHRLGDPQTALDWVGVGLTLNPSFDELQRLRVELSRQPSRTASSAATAFPRERVLAAFADLDAENKFSSADRNSTAESNSPSSYFSFRDAAPELGIAFRYENGKTSSRSIIASIGGGSLIIDIDHDEQPDICFPQGVSPGASSGIDVLLRGSQGQQYEDVSAIAGMSNTGHSLGGAVADIDGDGFGDLLICTSQGCHLLRNCGDGTFQRDTSSGVEFTDDCSAAAAFSDFNSDGLPDLYIVNYVSDWNRVCTDAEGRVETCDPRMFPACQDRVLLNTGTGEFRDLTDVAGIITKEGRGLGVVVTDLNGDNAADIYVANDGSPNVLLLNESDDQSLRFVERGMAMGVAVNGNGRSEAGMGIACDDFDTDGQKDLFVTNFFRETNTLYRGLGRGAFLDRTAGSGLAIPSRPVLGFGTQAVDIDLDGLPDLVVLNGDVDDFPDPARPYAMQAQALRNTGGRFADVSYESGEYFSQRHVGRGLSRVDINRDGRDDLIAVHHLNPAAVLLNNTTPSGTSRLIRLIGTSVCRDNSGGVLKVTLGASSRRLFQQSGSGYSASNERGLRLTLTKAGIEPRQAELTWGSRVVRRLDALTAYETVAIVERDAGRADAYGIPQ